MQSISDKLKLLLESFPEIKLVYLFGSRARKEEGALSDYDFAMYIEEVDSEKIFDIKLKLFAKMSKLLKTDSIDILILNSSCPPELKYFAITEGISIYEVEPYRVKVEPQILNEYFDFHIMLKKYNLTAV